MLWAKIASAYQIHISDLPQFNHLYWRKSSLMRIVSLIWIIGIGTKQTNLCAHYVQRRLLRCSWIRCHDFRTISFRFIISHEFLVNVHSTLKWFKNFMSMKYCGIYNAHSVVNILRSWRYFQILKIQWLGWLNVWWFYIYLAFSLIDKLVFVV